MTLAQSHLLRSSGSKGLPRDARRQGQRPSREARGRVGVVPASAVKSPTEYDGLRPPPPPLGVLAARRSVPDRRSARQGGRAQDAGAGDYRTREHVLVDHVPRSGAQARHQPAARLRSLRRAGGSADEKRHAGRNGKSPGPPGGDASGLSQSDQARLGRLHRGVLLQAAHRQGPAGAAFGRADRVEQLSQRRGGNRHSYGAAAEGAHRRGDLSRHSGSRQLLPRNAVSGDRRSASRQHRPATDRQGPRTAARVHERRALPAEFRFQAARHPAVHRHGQDGERHREASLSRRPVLSEDAAGDGRDLQGVPRSARQHGAYRRALQRRPVGDGQPSSQLRRTPPAIPWTTTSTTSSARASSSGCRACRSWPRAAC